jgi:hypothetical protein
MPAIATIIKMIESLPESAQVRVVERLRNYIEELRDEAEWDRLVYHTQPNLIEAARQAKRQIANGLSEPMDENQL